MKTVLVTGAGGQLGMSLRDTVQEFPGIKGEFLDRAALDIGDTEALEAAFEKYQPEYCVNCAAYTDVEGAEKDPETAMQINAYDAEALAKCCARHGTTLVHISTDYVFDGSRKAGYLPSDVPNPINAYGRSKWEGEQRIAAVLSNYFIIRTSWLYSTVYGPNFYLKVLEKAREGETLRVTDAQVGCPTRADHLARYIWGLIRDGRRDYGILHVTDGKAMSWYAFAQSILEEAGLLGQTKLLKADNYRTLAQRPKCSIVRTAEQG